MQGEESASEDSNDVRRCACRDGLGFRSPEERLIATVRDGVSLIHCNVTGIGVRLYLELTLEGATYTIGGCSRRMTLKTARAY